MDLSVVIPIKDEQDNLTRLHDCLTAALRPLPLAYEIVLVDDGSSDGSFALLGAPGRRRSAPEGRAAAAQLRPIGGDASRHRPRGRRRSSSPWTATCKTIRPTSRCCSTRLNEGYDAVFGLRAKRQDHFLIRKLPSWMANWLIRKVTGSTSRTWAARCGRCGATWPSHCRSTARCTASFPVLAQQAGAHVLQVAGAPSSAHRRQDQVHPDAHGPRAARPHHRQVHAQLSDPADARDGLGRPGVDGPGLVSLVVTVAMKWTTGHLDDRQSASACSARCWR